MSGGRICPHCKKYTAKNEARCIHCHKYLGPEFLSPVLRFFSDNDMWATTLLAGLCAAVFIGEVIAAVMLEGKPPAISRLILGSVGDDAVLRFGAIMMAEPFAEPWRLVCACFIHFNLLHLAANTMALFDFGRIIEPSLRGPRLVVGYTVTGVLGFVTSGLWYPALPVLTAGASGAVFGVQGLVLGQMLAAKDRRFQTFLFRTIGYSVVFYLVLHTNQAAHMGGLFAGIAMGFAFGKEKRPWQREKYFWAGAIACLLVTLGSLALAQWSYLHISLRG